MVIDRHGRRTYPALRELHSPALEVDLDPLLAQAPGLLGLVAGDQATGGVHDAPPRVLATGRRQDRADRAGRPRASGLERHLAVGHHVARPADRGGPGPQPAPTARAPQCRPQADAPSSASNLWFGVEIHSKYLASRAGDLQRVLGWCGSDRHRSASPMPTSACTRSRTRRRTGATRSTSTRGTRPPTRS